jgi:hypothetical protein
MREKKKEGTEAPTSAPKQTHAANPPIKEDPHD